MSDGSQNEWHFGRIKTYNDERGFGFVRDLSDQQEHFIHITKVKTPPISENEDVVFKLRPSTKKPDSFEAFDLIHLEKFVEDLGFLIQVFREKRHSSSVRENVLKSLKEPQLKYLFKEVIHTYAKEQEDGWIKSVIDIIMTYSSGDYQGLSNDFFISLVEEAADEELIFEVWEKKILPISIPEEAIKSTFLSIKKKDRVSLFNKIQEQGLRNELFELLLINESHETVFPFLRKFLTDKYKLMEVDVPSFDSNFWDEKPEYDLIKKTTQYYKKNLPPLELLKLTLNGDLDAFPKEYVFENFRELSRDQTKIIFESDFLVTDEKFHLLKKIIEFNNLVLTKTKDTRKGANGERLSEDKYWSLISESYEVLLKIAQKALTSSQLQEIDSLILDVFPEEIEYQFWSKGLLRAIPTKAISKKLLSNELGYQKLQKFISESKLPEDIAVGIVQDNLLSFAEIRSKSEFKCFHKHVSILVRLECSPGENWVITENEPFLYASLWMNREVSLKVDDIKPAFPFFEHEAQIDFIKRLFHVEHANNNVSVPIRHFFELAKTDDITSKSEALITEGLVDYSILVLVEAMKSLQEKQRLLFDSDLLKLFYKHIKITKVENLKAGHFFEKCEGRYEPEFKWKETEGKIEKISFGPNKFYYAISFPPGIQFKSPKTGGGWKTWYEKNPEFERLKEEVKKIPGRKWNPEKEHWGVPSKYEEEVFQFATLNRFFIDIEGNNYKNNTHLAEFKRGEVPNGITYCEGRLSNKLDNKFGKKFWWCNNELCFQNCKTNHSPKEWKNYTMLDMLKIYGFNLDDTNRVGDKIVDGQYYQFVSSVNRFNRLVDHLFCQECDQVLYPVDDSHFAHYRVTHFHCTNSNCSQHHEDIYLHHCLNGKCNGIIDSRVSEKCPNGLYICSNEACGTCCSTEMFKRRLEKLTQTGGYIHQNLQNAVSNNLGHLERKEYFCYQCGRQMKDIGTDTYQCENCNTTYEIGKNNYNGKSRSSSFDDVPY